MNMKSTKIAASVDASIVEPGVVGVSLLSPSSEALKTGTAASSGCRLIMADVAEPADALVPVKPTLIPAVFAIVAGMKGVRAFVCLVMRSLQRHVKKTLEDRKEDCDCSGSDVFDVGPMCLNVVSLSDKGVFKLRCQDPSSPEAPPVSLPKA